MARSISSHRTYDLPATMKAAAIDGFGGPDVITLHTLPVPEVGPKEVLIEIGSAGVGVWDADVRNGSWRPYGRPKFPLVLGTDGAGVVRAKGGQVRNFQIGDRVWACHYANPKGGFYAEYIAVDADHVGSVPRGLDPKEAGAGATTGLTAQQGIDDHLKLRAGETVLIFGATGAVGTLAIQFAKRRGAHVIATASSRTAAKLVKELGAAEAIDARKPDAPERLEDLAPEGLDAVLALAGGEDLDRLLDLVRSGGRVAHPNGIEPKPKRRRKYQVIAYDAEVGRREFSRLNRAAEEAHLRVPIAALYRLSQAARAHERLEKGHVLGRIALLIRDSVRGKSSPNK